ncbi:MAG: CHRD domain-containing protein [Ilumatobacteraceae bacterium]|nr:CHRD domain-containing protein [Ilumatobacteraceae bacterium]
MQKRNLFALMAVGLAAAIAVPTIALGNARTNNSNQTPQTPLVSRMLGANEVPAPGAPPATATNDPDGFGSASVTFDLVTAPPNVCWDMSYGSLTGTPLAGHIHGPAAPGVTAGVVIAFSGFGPTSATGCRDLTAPEAVIAADIVANPQNYYTNVHTSDFGGGAIRGQLARSTPPSGEAHLLPSPVRAYDSRTADGPLAPNQTRTVSLQTGKDGAQAVQIAVPAGATGAIVTLTVTDTTVGVGGPGGFLTMYSAALATPPSTSSINWTGAGQNLAVSTQVAVDASGSVKVTDGANATNFVIDVLGYVF